MSRTQPLRARRLNLPGREPAVTDEHDEYDAYEEYDEYEVGAADRGEPPSVQSFARVPAPAPPVPQAAPAEPVAAPPPFDEWESLRGGGTTSPPAKKKAKAGNSPLTRTIIEFPLLIIVAALIAFLVRTFVAQAFYIPSESMTPQLQVNDRIVVSKLAYRLHEPRRGDIVVFDNPRPVETIEPERTLPVRLLRSLGEAVGLVQPSTEEFIKRVIGLPGETVEGRDNKILINGRALEEPYLLPTDPIYDFPPVTVPEGRLWVMGDNRDGSSDSRSFGPIEKSSIVGRAVVRVWPLGDASFL